MKTTDHLLEKIKQLHVSTEAELQQEFWSLVPDNLINSYKEKNTTGLFLELKVYKKN